MGLVGSARLAALCIGVLCRFGGAAAAEWPARPITLVVPFAAGGTTDAVARIVAQKVGEKLGENVVVDNRPGAGGMLGAQLVARAEPDGYTLLMGSFGNMMNEFMYRRPLVDMRRELRPVGQAVSVPNYVGVNPRLGIQSFPDLLAAARARPGKLTCATSGTGTSGDLACTMLKSMAGIDVVNVPYKGGGPAMVDVMGGHADFLVINDVLPYLKDGRIKGVAITSLRPSPMAPGLAPVADTVPGFELVAWYGVFAPARTPQAVVDRFSAAMAAILKTDDSTRRLADLGATPVGSTPAAFRGFVDKEFERWGGFVKANGIVAQD